jgi:hypothetical protein
MRVLQDECGWSLKHKTGFIHKEMERISLGPSGKCDGAAERQEPSPTESSLMSEVRQSSHALLTVDCIASGVLHLKRSGRCAAEIHAGAQSQSQERRYGY